MPAAVASPDWQAVRFPSDFRIHQRRALEAIDSALAQGSRRMWVVLPPGTGKTLVGLEAARRIGSPFVAFGPNTAIQSQWLAEWRRFTPQSIPAGTSRDLSAPVTALTYQALATFDPDAEVDEEGHQHLPRIGRRRTSTLLDRLHDNGRALVKALEQAGPVTLILDECHHLLEVWGRLLAELLEDLPDAQVIGLTATPPETLSTDQAALIDELFGRPLFSTSIPAVVREGHLAPFSELAWFATPTPTESQWLASQAERFAELQTDLVGPTNATTGFLTWVDERFVTRSATTENRPSGVSAGVTSLAAEWSRLERSEPELTEAALRFHYAELLALPRGATMREEHRHRPTAEDWVALLGDYVKSCLLPSTAPGDLELLEQIRGALPSVGYQLTKLGIRRGRSPVDRVMARSEGKTMAAVEILAAEEASLGGRLRSLVVCDHESATATLPARLEGVLAAEAGSARLVLANLLADDRTATLEPVLITGKTVAADAVTARKLIAFVREQAPSIELDAIPDQARGIVEVTGRRWRSRSWVPLVTRFYETGGSRALVGTRALLGEGWDAKGVNSVIDLTTATTPTAVVQTRGRALRVDPAWPEKVANSWTVVCVSERHPDGISDWKRFVRKHHGYFGVTESGEIASGVGHVDPTLSPYEPIREAEFDGFNAQMLERARDREHLGELWQVGTPYRDELVHTIRVRFSGDTAAESPSDALSPPEPPATVPGKTAPPRPGWLRRPAPPALLGERPDRGVAVPAAFGCVLIALGIWRKTWLLDPLALTVSTRRWQRWHAQHRDVMLNGGRTLHALATPPGLLRFAYAIADALEQARFTDVGADGVRASVEPDGSYRVSLHGVDTATSELFTTSLDEVLAPLAAPRYVIAQYVLDEVDGHEDALLEAGHNWLEGISPEPTVVYHSVPSALSTNAQRRSSFVTAWRKWISDAVAVDTSGPVGEGIVVTHRGEDPFAATTRLRVAWD